MPAGRVGLRCAAGRGLCVSLSPAPVTSMAQIFSELLPGLGVEGRNRPLTLCEADWGDWRPFDRGADKGSEWGKPLAQGHSTPGLRHKCIFS